jgi:hypothetical protein
MTTVESHPEPENTRRDYDPSPPPPNVLAAHGARVLDPATAERLEGVAPRSTVYVGDRLLFSARRDPSEVLGMVAEVARSSGFDAEIDPESPDTELEYGVRAVRFVLRPEEPARPPDAWSLLLWTRSRFGPEAAADLSLDHVLGANARIMDIISTTPRSAHPEDEQIADYIRRCGGHRQPVAPMVLAPPRRRDDELAVPRPKVAILDTGCGAHAWLDGITQRELVLDGRHIGSVDHADDPVDDADERAKGVAGHGTFMAGLVHMNCPDADLVAIPVVGDDGLVEEHDLALALAQLVELIRRGQSGADGLTIDVVVLSMGYYHETDEEGPFAPILAASLRALGRMGVIVVAAAGNDATSRPMYPAALAPWGDRNSQDELDDSVVPVVSVGAQNPDGSSALFSNAGPWVRAWARGSGVLSTVPDLGGGQRSSRGCTTHSPGSIDPQGYSSGFAMWSGTSFAASVVAGQLAAALMQIDRAGLSESERVARAWEAIRLCTPLQT